MNKKSAPMNSEATVPDLPSLPGIVSTPIPPEVPALEDSPELKLALAETEEVAPTPQPQDLAPRSVKVSITLPIGYLDPTAYVPARERAEVKAMSREQATSLRRLTRGLEDSGAKLKDGSPIKRNGQAVRWLLEQIAAQFAKAE